MVANPTVEGVWLHDGDDGPDGRAPGGGVGVGGLFGDPGSWWHIGATTPEGTYALARWDVDVVELISDSCASRTIWYTRTEDAFLASTSQRALIMLLGSFELEPEATACFLSSGTLGPTVSWDARLRRLPPNARAVLGRASWRLALHEAPFELNAIAGEAGADVARLRKAVATTCGGLNLDLERWVLTLSGGRDSRTLLAFLVENGLRPRCVTWTTRASLHNPLSDASIARRLARRYRVEHELLYLDTPDVDADATLARFVAADEGRNDAIAGYLDGFALWRDLARAGVQGVIRGDQAMGASWRPKSAENVRVVMYGAAQADFPAGHIIRRLELVPQTWPSRLHIGPHERLVDYGLRHEERGYNAVFLAGLNGPKARYLEIVNPLLSQLVIGAVHASSPRSRDDYRAYRRIADGLDRAVPYARFGSLPSESDFLSSGALVEALVRELANPAVERVLPGDGALLLLTALTIPGSDDRTTPAARRLLGLAKEASICLPHNLAYRLGEWLRPVSDEPDPLSNIQLAFRVALASRTVSLFEDDATAGGKDADG